MKVLHLTLKKHWFDQIAAGKKKIEYREEKPYWIARLVDDAGYAIIFDEIVFKNGYSKTAPTIRARHKDTDLVDGMFEIKLGKILEVRR